MHISYLKIENFRGIDIEINNINNIVTIIGQNARPLSIFYLYMVWYK